MNLSSFIEFNSVSPFCIEEPVRLKCLDRLPLQVVEVLLAPSPHFGMVVEQHMRNVRVLQVAVFYVKARSQLFC